MREALSDDFARTTVLTVLRTLEDEGYVAHTAEGKAHRYRAAVTPEAAGQSALRRLIDTVFFGAPERLLAQMVSVGARRTGRRSV